MAASTIFASSSTYVASSAASSARTASASSAYKPDHRWETLAQVKFDLANQVGALVYQKEPHRQWSNYFRLNIALDGRAVCKGALGKTVNGVDMVSLYTLELQSAKLRDKGFKAQELYGKSLFIDPIAADTVRYYAKED